MFGIIPVWQPRTCLFLPGHECIRGIPTVVPQSELRRSLSYCTCIRLHGVKRSIRVRHPLPYVPAPPLSSVISGPLGVEGANGRLESFMHNIFTDRCHSWYKHARVGRREPWLVRACRCPRR
jgi:hypothetical protein